MANQDFNIRSVPDLKQFGTDLNKAGATLDVIVQHLNSKINQALEGWNDDNARAFAAEFERSKVQLAKISQDMQQFSSYINRRCEILEQAKNIHW